MATKNVVENSINQGGSAKAENYLQPRNGINKGEAPLQTPVEESIQHMELPIDDKLQTMNIRIDNNAHSIVKTEVQDCSSNSQPLVFANNTGAGKIADTIDQSPTAAYKCSCGMFFEKSTDLAAHKRWTCKQVEKKVSCDICKSWFAHEHGLKRHMKHAHDGVFSCSKCSLCFHNRIKLTRHWMESHYDEKNAGDKLKCFLCGDECFTSKFDLESHLLNHKYNRLKVRKDKADSQTSRGDSMDTGMETRVSSASECIAGDLSQQHKEEIKNSIPAHCSPLASNMLPYIYNFPGRRHHHRHGHHRHGHRRRNPQFIHPFFADSEIHSHLPFPPQFPHHSPESKQPPHHHHHFHPPPTLPHHPPHCYPPPPNPDIPQSSSEGQEIPHPFHCDFHPHYPHIKNHKKHMNRWKWKKYFKTIMNHYLAPWSAEIYPPASVQGFKPQPSEQPTQSTSAMDSTLDTPTSSSDFQTACTFRGQNFGRKTDAQPSSQGISVLPPNFECNICGKTFKKPHKLIQHRQRQRHFKNTPADLCAFNELQEKLDTVLGFQSKPNSSYMTSSSVSKTSQNNSTEDCTTTSELIPQPACELSGSETLDTDHNSLDEKDLKEEQSTIVCKDVDGKESEINEASENGDIKDKSNLSSFQCSVCGVTVGNSTVLSVHLQAHITHVTAVQKVQEWKNKSSPYFCNEDKDDSALSSTPSYMDSFVDSESTATDTSFQDAASLQMSTPTSVVESSSQKSATVLDPEKWLKPRCHRKKRGCEKATFPCEFCNKTFAFKRALVFHMKEQHGDKKPQLECPLCHKKFSWNNRGQFFERHLNSHYGITVFKHKCDICDKTFLEKSKLQAHVMTKHSSELLHTCDVCGKGYGTKSSLTRHRRQHTGDKRHQCKLCSESFMEKRELVRHMAVHTGAPAFECQHCGQGFTLKTSLATHIKRKHPELP